MEERYVEWVKTPRGRKGTMIPTSLIPKIVKASYSSGYTSVYSFSKEDAEEIKASRSSAGFSRYEVGADGIAIDLDDGGTQLEETETILQREGLGYEVWFSGKKGHHLFIDTEYVCSTHLPYSHLQYILSLGITCDESLYQHGRILSLEGRIHPKTGIKKHFIRKVEGDMAVVEIVEKPPFVFTGSGEDGGLDLGDTLIQVANLASCEPRKEMRHTELWCMSKDLIKCGLAQATIFDLLTGCMRDWDYPKSEDKLIEIIKMGSR